MTALRKLWHDLRARWRDAPRVRIMVWAVLVSTLCGITVFLQPLDDRLRDLRYQWRAQPADGSVVVVGIDRESRFAVGNKWPWPRSGYATLVERLKQSGARKVMFDLALSTPDTDAENRKFREVAQRYTGDLYLGVGFGDRDGREVNRLLRANPAIRPAVREATMMGRVNTLGQFDRLYHGVQQSGTYFPGIAPVVTGRESRSLKWFRPDFAIQSDTIPYFSARDVLQGRVDSDQLRGKDVLIGLHAAELGDIKFVPGQGQRPGVYVHAIGVETLRRGIPVEAGWLGAAALVWILGAVMLWTRDTRALVVLGVSGAGGLLFAPLVFDSQHIWIDVGPAALAFIVIVVQNARLRIAWQKSRTNELSGLENAIAFREVGDAKTSAVVAAKVRNYSAIVASLGSGGEAELARGIIARLRAADHDLHIYQAEDGVFYWLLPSVASDALTHHFDALSRFFLEPLAMPTRKIDLALAFGADVDVERPVASRAASALLSAERAMREGVRFRVYDPATAADAAWQLGIVSAIDTAIERDEFWLAYQPKLELVTNRIVGAEVLLRWAHPERGLIMPGDFIPAAEHSGRIARLTDYVVTRVVDVLAATPPKRRVKFAVNVSAPVFAVPGFADRLTALCDRKGVERRHLVLELTESTLIAMNDPSVLAAVEQLHATGFGLSIDDFGTGFASLDYVSRLPATEVKIDQGFVRRMHHMSADRVIVESVVRMARELGRRTVAEGVETHEDMRVLREIGCDEVQGYLIGKPMTLADFGARLTLPSARAA